MDGNVPNWQAAVQQAREQFNNFIASLTEEETTVLENLNDYHNKTV